MIRLLLGLAARVPFLDGRVVNRGRGGAHQAEYCYGVWLKHLALLRAAGCVEVPASVAELGPGDSLGTGLAALLSGADTYHALDSRRFSEHARNERVLDELLELFRSRAPRPTRGWPDFDAHLDDHLFPSQVLGEVQLARALAPARVDSIRQALRNEVSDDGRISIRYVAPWHDPRVIERQSVKLIFSHSVLEHVRDIDHMFSACAQWLTPDGWMSHQVDLQAHGLARAWNGAWRIESERYWELLAGRRDCWINRLPASAYLEALRCAGFNASLVLRNFRTDGIGRGRLAPRWRGLSDEDLRCAGLFLHARVRPAGPEA